MSDAQRPQEPLSSGSLLLTPEEAAEVLRVGRTTIYASTPEPPTVRTSWSTTPSLPALRPANG